MKYKNIVSRNIANQICEKYTCHASHLVGHHVEQHVSQEQFFYVSFHQIHIKQQCLPISWQSRPRLLCVDYYSENVVTSFKKGISTRLTRRLLQVKLKNVARKGCNLNINAVALGPCRSVCGGSWLPPSLPHDVSN